MQGIFSSLVVISDVQLCMFHIIGVRFACVHPVTAESKTSGQSPAGSGPKLKFSSFPFLCLDLSRAFDTPSKETILESLLAAIYHLTLTQLLSQELQRTRLSLLGHCLRLPRDTTAQKALDLTVNNIPKARQGRPRTCLLNTLRAVLKKEGMNLRTASGLSMSMPQTETQVGRDNRAHTLPRYFITA